jgi:hypothetical protein
MRRFTACAALVGLLLLSAASAEATVAGHQASSVVGVWGQVHRCQQLVDALDAQGLSALAPGVVSDYFPNRTSTSSLRSLICARERSPSGIITSSLRTASSALSTSSTTRWTTALGSRWIRTHSGSAPRIARVRSSTSASVETPWS